MGLTEVAITSNFPCSNGELQRAEREGHFSSLFSNVHFTGNASLRQALGVENEVKGTCALVGESQKLRFAALCLFLFNTLSGRLSLSLSLPFSRGQDMPFHKRE